MTQSSEGSGNGVDRRRFIKAAGTVAWATPLILTITSGRAGASVPGTFCGFAVGGPGGPCPNLPNCSSPAPVCRRSTADNFTCTCQVA